jgi:hypothetical protein
MAFVRDVVTGAYNRLALLSVGSDLDPDRAAEGLTVFNDMVAGLVSDGILPSTLPSAPKASWKKPAVNTFPPYGPQNQQTPSNISDYSYQLSDTFPYDPRFVHGFKAILAVELANNNGITANPSTQQAARRAHNQMLAFYVVAPVADTDTGLRTFPSLRRYGTGGGIIIG